MARDARPVALEILSRIEKLKRLRSTGPLDVSVGSDTRDIVERCIEVISEASRRLPVELKARYPEVPWRNVADIGNVLRHHYDGVIEPVLTDVVLYQIDELERAVQNILLDLNRE